MKKYRYTFRKGGIHPPENKGTSGSGIVDMALPRRVQLLVGQHIGTPAVPVVNVGDVVGRGQLVAAESGSVSAPVHTPISGVVTKIHEILSANGTPAVAIEVEADEDRHLADENACKCMSPVRSVEEALSLPAAEIRRMAGEFGVVGLGGAAFPARVKLTVPVGTVIDLLIVNGAECEPFLTCDDALMRACPSEIIAGVRLMMRASGAPEAIIGIEDNKPEAIGALMSCVEKSSDIKVVALKTKYPQGGEKQLVQALTGRFIESGALPASVGVVVHNVATAHALFKAVVYGIPVTDRIITVAGDVLRPGNYRVAVGTRLGSVIDTAGGLRVSASKVILGGPMMGRAVSNVDAPTVKGVSGIIVIPESGARRAVELPCIRCGECLKVCPMGLEPYLLGIYGQMRLVRESEMCGVLDCIECGCCSYSCPANRPLLDYIRLSKKTVADSRRSKRK